MALTTTDLEIHYDFSNSSCYPGSGTTVTNLGSSGSTYNGTIAGSTVAYSSSYGGILDFSGTSGRIAIPHNTAVTGVANNTVNRTIQVWVKLNTLKTGTSVQGIVGKLTNLTGADGYIFYTKSNGSIAMTLNAAIESVPTSSASSVTTNEWTLLTITFNTANVDNSVKIYKNDNLLTISPTKYNGNWSTTETNQLFLGQGYRSGTTTFTDPLDGQIGGFYMYDRQLTAQEVADNFNATKSRYFPAIDITITETPATATNGHFPEPSISTTTGVSYGSEPATATAEISYLAVSGEVNYLDSYRQATALMVNPTLAFTFNDHSEIVTSISVSALMVDPSSIVTNINITNSSDAMTASADIGTHNVIAGSSNSYPADQATASAEMIEPLNFGPDDTIAIATPMTASALMANGVGSVTPNYFNLVKQLDPIYYVYDGQRNSPATVNSGNTTFTTAFDTGVVTVNGGAPLSLIGNGNSWQTTGSASVGQITIAGTAGIDALKAMHKTKTWSYEWWFKPTSYGWEPNLTNKTYWFDNGYFGAYAVTGTIYNYWTTMSLNLRFNETSAFDSSFTIPKSAVSINNWHHFVINATETITGQQQLQVWIDGLLYGTNTFTFTPTSATVDSALSSFVFNANNTRSLTLPYYDEIAFYNKSLTNNQIIEHYNFIDTTSPNRILFVDEFTADIDFVDPVILAIDNNNFPATPITASQLFVDPVIIAQKNINISSDPITASALLVNPSFYGTPDYRQDAVPMIASAEKGNNSFALDDRYYSYVYINLAPFRYVTLDGPSVYIDYGSDNDYAVVPTAIGGTVVNPGYGINNKSVLTTSQPYSNSGIIMKESEWNDTWGTGQFTYHSAFWMQSTPQDTSNNGLKVLWNLNGYKDNQHVILYQYQNKLHLQFNNGSGTHIDSPTASNYNLFDGNRHFILINFNHTNTNNNTVNLYVDSVLVSTINLGTYTGTTTNSATSLPTNDEAYNYPRLCAGGLITPFNVTALPVEPSNISILVDELYWAQTGANQTLVTNIYNAMPVRTNKVWPADFFIASNANLPMPSIGAGNTRIATASTATAELVNPTLIVDYDKIISATPIDASALLVMPVVEADNVLDISVLANVFIASAFINDAIAIITIPGGTMTATAKMNYNNPYFDLYNLLIMQESLAPFATKSAYNWYATGDIDS